MNLKKERTALVVTGLIIGTIAALLVLLGNPAYMGFCIACFVRDIAGSLKLHQAAPVQYMRPEILGLVLGSCLMALGHKEFSAKGGSSPMTRFILGIFVMIGSLMFLGCPIRMLQRLAGGDGNALFGLLGFVAGILAGVFFLNRGYTLKRTYRLPAAEGAVLPLVQVVFLVLLVAAPSLLVMTKAGEGPGGSHAPLILSLAAGLLVGALAQRTRLCIMGGIRDLVLFRDGRLLLGFAGIFVSVLIWNLALGNFHPGFVDQPVAHTDGLWNALGMVLTGFGSVLLGGCPMRQLVLAGSGNTDSAVTILGLTAGAAIAHNFGLASSPEGPTPAGKAAVLIGIAVVALIAWVNSRRTKEA